MPDRETTDVAQEALGALPEIIRAWWTSVLTGHVDAPHPVHGGKLATRLEGTTLIVSGTVATEEDRRGIAAETEHLQGRGITTVRNELEVVPEVTDERGLLVQTLVGIFESATRAGFAQGYLEGNAHVRPQLIRVISPDNPEDARAELRALLPEAFWADAGKALDEGHALLILTVDETEAFKARELLDEDTHSLQTLLLPPEAAGNTASAQRSLDKVMQVAEGHPANGAVNPAGRVSLH